MENEITVTLKPCPFCGPGELQTFRLGSRHFVQCQKCDIEQTGRSEAEAITAWNTRTQPEVKAVEGDVVEDWLGGDWFEKWQDATENASEELMVTLNALRGRVERTILAALTKSQDSEAVGLLPRLDAGLITAAMVGHYGEQSREHGIDGLDLTSDSVSWPFREGFKRMWAGVRKELKRRRDTHLSTNEGEGA